MGGMIALRAVLRHPGFFSGMILNGPLIVPGPQIGPIDFRSTPIRTLVSKTGEVVIVNFCINLYS